MGEKIRIVTVGTGYFSHFHHSAWNRLAQEGRVELAAVCNRHITGAQDFANQYGFKAAFSDLPGMVHQVKPDLIDIITPSSTHPEYVRFAVDNGITAICQKPFTQSYLEAEDLVSYIRRKSGSVVIHDNFRFQPWYRKIRQVVDDGLIGEPYQVTFRLRPGDGQGSGAYLDRQPYFQKMQRFLVHETAIHMIDTFRYLFGSVDGVFAHLRKLNPVIAGEDSGIILFTFRNGRIGLLDGNRLADHETKDRRLTMGEMCVEGSKGTLTLDGYARIRLRIHGSNVWRDIEFDWENRDFGGDCVYLLQRHVLDFLQKNTPVMNSAEEYLINLKIEDAVYRSAASSCKIEL